EKSNAMTKITRATQIPLFPNLEWLGICRKLVRASCLTAAIGHDVYETCDSSLARPIVRGWATRESSPSLAAKLQSCGASAAGSQLRGARIRCRPGRQRRPKTGLTAWP